MRRGPAFVPILTYHSLVREGDVSANGLYTLAEKSFQAQMAYLAEHRFHAVSLKEVLAWQSGRVLPGKSIVITCDDGSESDFSIAVPILKRFRFSATFFVNPGTLGQDGTLTAERVKQMHREGMEIGSHGFDHLFLTRLDDKALHHQIVGSKKRLEALLESPVPFFSIPRGRTNRRVTERVKEAGYLAACTSDIGFNERRSEPFRLRRWAVKRSYSFDDFVSIVEGSPKKHLYLEVQLKQVARRLLGHTLYEAARHRILGEQK